MEFRLLGTVEAVRGGAPVAVGPAMQRGVLAALLADAGRVVRTGDLVERVWGDARPRRAAPTLYSYLSRLRVALDGGPALEATSARRSALALYERQGRTREAAALK
ncbi:winged helix-turn-helix domain-containing protein [Dactylosporangium sp. AC04546]|uniref:AfsR/SARP family transcriptional regulator n=1 Tax=Dactylosporangium sp. AC04546 TaxID=2862460 RepID=UPI001EE0FC95|nr:winged helix-turn-helix domain-containing protein [Dactylosporangium sp. AC04546]WVK88382.1 winged helix-turn-helix domain-containing protein [Dactylosporangium sp. AC04546]